MLLVYEVLLVDLVCFDLWNSISKMIDLNMLYSLCWIQNCKLLPFSSRGLRLQVCTTKITSSLITYKHSISSCLEATWCNYVLYINLLNYHQSLRLTDDITYSYNRMDTQILIQACVKKQEVQTYRFFSEHYWNTFKFKIK